MYYYHREDCRPNGGCFDVNRSLRYYSTYVNKPFGIV